MAHAKLQIMQHMRDVWNCLVKHPHTHRTLDLTCHFFHSELQHIVEFDFFRTSRHVVDFQLSALLDLSSVVHLFTLLCLRIVFDSNFILLNFNVHVFL